jgi:hypothetical protein
VLRAVGTGVAYVWDTVKAAAGAVAWVSGGIVQGFGKVLEIVALAAKQLDALARELPEAIRPDWVGKAAAAVDGFAGKVGDVGAGMSKWGAEAVMGFGGAAAQFNKWFDGVEARFRGDRTTSEEVGRATFWAARSNRTAWKPIPSSRSFEAGIRSRTGRSEWRLAARAQVRGFWAASTEKFAGLKAG